MRTGQTLTAISSQATLDSLARPLWRLPAFFCPLMGTDQRSVLIGTRALLKQGQKAKLDSSVFSPENVGISMKTVLVYNLQSVEFVFNYLSVFTHSGVVGGQRYIIEKYKIMYLKTMF